MKSVTRTVLIVAMVLVPATLFALELRVGEQPSISSGERIEGDTYIAGGSVQSSGIIEGDLIVAGGSILINGSVLADIIAVGGNITILGTVGDDVRVAGGNIIISAPIGGDLVVGGGQVQITGAGVDGDLLVGGGVVHIDAPIKGNIHIGGGEIFLNAPVTGNVEFNGDKLTLGKSANIGGDLTYRAKKEAVIEEGAVVQGGTKYESWENAREGYKSPLPVILSIFVLGKFFALLVCSLLLGLFFRRYANELVQKAVAQPLLEIGRGFVTLIVLPVASMLLFVTLVGIPLGILGMVSFIGAIVFSLIAVPIVLGSVAQKWIFKGDHYEVSWKTILLGAVLYAILGVVPFVGWIIACGFMLLTLGAAVNIKWGLVRTWR
ncbi:MAG: hypothetical protein Q7S11_04420 [bacterium]|nr:hypothetical protein [bacterium]